MAEDSELWDVICDGPFVYTKTNGNPAITVPKTRKEFKDADQKDIEKNFCAKKILVCGIGPDEYNRISACKSRRSGKLSKQLNEGRRIHSGYAHSLTSIINELHSLGEIIPRNKLVRKILSVLPGSWESKVYAITEAKDLLKLTMDELVGNLKTYEMKKKKDNERREPKREKNLVLKTDNDSGGEDADMAYLTKKFQKMVRRSRSIPKRDEDEEDDDKDEVNFLDVQRNLKSYSQKKLISLANVLIDAYHNLIDDKNALTTELGEIKHERDDLVVVACDLRETIGSLKREKYTLTERIANIEHEKDDLLVVVVDLKETIEELRRENRPVNTKKVKEVASEAHLKLENELRLVKSSLCAELEKNKQLQEELGRVKSVLEKSLKWTWSSDSITVLYTNNGENGQGIGFQKEKTRYNPHSKKDLVRGLHKSSFKDHRVCDACVKVKQVRSSFKLKKTKYETPSDIKELGPSITITEAENRVVDVVHGTPAAEVRNMTHGLNPEEHESFLNKIQVSNWKHKSSHLLQNIITPLDSEIQT
uniref:Myosin-16-like n=1 Tax=Nicotiana tabacum TaxID=4097 RepID=A0A1S4CX45_TOBAC